jgi:ribosomal protein S18 acetylase RimI-like enzyme
MANWQPLQPAPPALEVRQGALLELISFRETMAKPLPQDDFYADRIYGLSRFWLGLWENQVAHISWVSPHACTVKIQLEPGAVEVRNVCTLETYRARQICTYVLAAIMSDLKRDGLHTAYAHVAEGNTPSLRAFARLGFRPVGTVSESRVVGLKQYHYELWAYPETSPMREGV